MALILFSILLYRRTYPLRIIRFKTLEKRFTIMALAKNQKKIRGQKYLTAFVLVLVLTMLFLPILMVTAIVVKHIIMVT